MTERPWLKHYPSGMPANINPDQYPSLLGILDETFNKYRHKSAFAGFGKELTFDEVDKMSRNFAAYLHSRGLEPGDSRMPVHHHTGQRPQRSGVNKPRGVQRGIGLHQQLLRVIL